MKLPINISNDSHVPIYQQIVSQVSLLIVNKQLKTEQKLPSIRGFSNDLEVSSITVRRAYQELEKKGFIETIQGKGTYIRELDTSQQKHVEQDVLNNAMNEVIEIARGFNYSNEMIEKTFKEQLIKGGD